MNDYCSKFSSFVGHLLPGTLGLLASLFSTGRMPCTDSTFMFDAIHNIPINAVKMHLDCYMENILLKALVKTQ